MNLFTEGTTNDNNSNMSHRQRRNQIIDVNENRKQEQNSTEEKMECNNSQSLPELHNDILINIFSYLLYTDLTQARLVCRRWMELICCTRFSKKFCLLIKKDNVEAIWKQLQTGCFRTEMQYRHMIYMGIDLQQIDKLQCILQKIGCHVLSLKLRTLFGNNILYEYFPNLERLVLEGLYVFSTDIPFKLNLFPNLKGIHFVDDSVKQSSSQTLLSACLSAKTTVRLEELSIRVYAEHSELFLTVLKDHAATLYSLHVVYFESMGEPNSIAKKWLQVFSQLKKLEKIKIYSCNTPIFEGTLKCLETLPLRYLEVDCLRPVNPNIFQLLQSCSASLEHLAFFNFYLPKSIVGTHTISEHCRNLKKLILSYTRLIDEDELCNIAKNLVGLEVLVLRYCKNAVTNKSLTAIFKHLTQLRELDLSGNNDFSLNALKGTLPLDKPTSSSSPYAIQRLRRLEKLNLKSCQQLNNDDFLETLKFPFLRSLSFGRGIYTDSGIQNLVRQCPLLEELTITYCPTLGRSALLCIAKSLPRLRVLHLLHCAQVDKSVRLILYAECPLLTDLEISEKRANVKTYFHQ